MPLRFTWRRTWRDRPDDYTAINEAGHTIRVYLDKVSPAFAGYANARRDEEQRVIENYARIVAEDQAAIARERASGRS